MNDLEIVLRHAVGEEPANIEMICAELGVGYAEPVGMDHDGSILMERGRFRIAVDAALSSQQRRFTGAHELAHYLMHRDIIAAAERPRKHRDTLFGKTREGEGAGISAAHNLQADRLAVQILMPAKKIRRMLKDGASLEDLSHAMDVSQPTIAIRLNTLRSVSLAV